MPEYVQKMQTKRLMQINPVATRAASLQGLRPIEYPDDAAKATAQILWLIH